MRFTANLYSIFIIFSEKLAQHGKRSWDAPGLPSYLMDVYTHIGRHIPGSRSYYLCERSIQQPHSPARIPALPVPTPKQSPEKRFLRYSDRRSCSSPFRKKEHRC